MNNHKVSLRDIFIAYFNAVQRQNRDVSVLPKNLLLIASLSRLSFSSHFFSSNGKNDLSHQRMHQTYELRVDESHLICLVHTHVYVGKKIFQKLPQERHLRVFVDVFSLARKVSFEFFCSPLVYCISLHILFKQLDLALHQPVLLSTCSRILLSTVYVT